MSPRSTSHGLPVRLRRLLIAALIATQVLTTVGILVSSHATSVGVLLEHSRELLSESAQVSVTQTQGFLEPAIRSARLTSEVTATMGTDSSLESFLVELIEANPEFDAVYYASTDGKFISVANDLSVVGAATRTKVTDQQTGSQVWWRSSDGRIVLSDNVDDDWYIPATRSWFKRALVAEEPVWTDLYTSFTSQQLGVTVSIANRDAQGVAQGVVGIDIGLTALSSFLEGLDVSERGSSFIVDSQGRTVAFPGADEAIARDRQFLNLAMIDDPISRAVYEDFQALGLLGGRRFSGFEFEGEAYQAVYVPMRIDDDHTWTLAVYAPENDFVGTLRTNERLIIAMAMVISAILIAAGYWVATKVTVPVQELKARAETDPLTGLFDRRHFMEISGQMSTQAVIQDEPFCVALLDIDKFKAVNDTYGHGVGDEVLTAMADRLSHALRENDLVARFGGEEFALALPKSDLQSAFGVIDRLRLGISEKPIRTSAGPISISFSAGVAQLSLEFSDVDALLLEADRALYRAKELGRNCVVAAGV